MSDRQLTILIVDDDRFMQSAICMLIKNLKHKLLIASSGLETLNILRAQKVDLVFSDIQMPEGTGLFILEEIRRTSMTMPLVHLMTGETDVSKAELVSKGAAGVLLKPFKKQQLVSIIGDALNIESVA